MSKPQSLWRVSLVEHTHLFTHVHAVDDEEAITTALDIYQSVGAEGFRVDERRGGTFDWDARLIAEAAPSEKPTQEAAG